MRTSPPAALVEHELQRTDADDEHAHAPVVDARDSSRRYGGSNTNSRVMISERCHGRLM
jgi:hypothetical protein